MKFNAKVLSVGKRPCYNALKNPGGERRSEGKERVKWGVCSPPLRTPDTVR